MTTMMDIAVCLDCAPSIGSYFNEIRSNMYSIFGNTLIHYLDMVRMAYVEFQSHSNAWITRTHPFTSSMDIFRQWFNIVQTNEENSNGTKSIVDALDACLKLDWNNHNNIDQFYEKLVILITDGPPCHLINECSCNSKDLWKMANEFEKKNITLVVIGIEPSIIAYNDFYCALAKKTGGEYIPLKHASRVLSSVIPHVLLGEDTLFQSFRHLNTYFDIELDSLYHYSYMHKRVRYMIEKCKTMNDIRKWLFTYRHQLNRFISDNTNVVNIDFESLTPSIRTIDDEGYRTRLPTTASADSCFTHINSPILSYHTDLDWTSEIEDDECF